MFDQTLTPLLSWLQIHGLRISLILAGAWLLARLLSKILLRWERRMEALGDQAQAERQRRARTLIGIAHGFALAGILLMVVLLILPELGLDVAPLMAGAGIVGLILGLGAQTLIKDFLGGLFILLEEQFYVGDVVRIGEISGTVERITLRATYVRDLEGRLHLIPNGEIRIVANHSKGWSRAVVDIEVDCGEDIGRVMATLEEACQALAADVTAGPLLLEPPAVIGVEGLTDTAVRLRVMARTRAGQHWDVARLLRRQIKEAFEQAGIRTPRGKQEVFLRE